MLTRDGKQLCFGFVQGFFYAFQDSQLKELIMAFARSRLCSVSPRVVFFKKFYKNHTIIQAFFEISKPDEIVKAIIFSGGEMGFTNVS